ncbi:MAG: flavodoxin [Myxococcota bacterium]|nr:flavodoxin [Myxococcota bacterium]
MKVGIVFGTCTGNTEELAEVIREQLGLEEECLQDVARMEAADLANFDFLIVGIPTWHIGELQDDWYGIHEDLDEVDMTGTKIALFGLGDQLGYSDTFLDGMGILYDKFLERGATGNIGFWPTEGFEFDDSKALKDGQFCGLAIDQDCQPELTDERVEKWCQILKEHLAQKAA